MIIILHLTLSTLFVTICAFDAIAQDVSNGPSPAGQWGIGKQLTPEQFAAMKSRILNMIEVRREKLDEKKACVTAAQTPVELGKCRQHHWMNSGAGQQGHISQQSPQPSEDRQK
ncbi:MAG TPA: hypothetical protein VLX29_07015 [Nitrospirota bacterium]|nr:hypothetical protein [Nitrospirota bacterium]